MGKFRNRMESSKINESAAARLKTVVGLALSYDECLNFVEGVTKSKDDVIDELQKRCDKIAHEAGEGYLKEVKLNGDLKRTIVRKTELEKEVEDLKQTNEAMNRAFNSTLSFIMDQRVQVIAVEFFQWWYLPTKELENKFSSIDQAFLHWKMTEGKDYFKI